MSTTIKPAAKIFIHSSIDSEPIMVLPQSVSNSAEDSIKILFFDTETNSLDTERGFVQELAWAIYDVESCRLLKSYSFVLKWNMQYEVDPGALAATGLTREFCEAEGIPAQDALIMLLGDIVDVDAVCGHNIIDFDVKILHSNILRTCFSKPEVLLQKFKIDTMYDLPFTKKPDSMKLKYLAYDHGYSMTNAHQAMADVFACAHVFFQYKTRDVIPIAATELVTICGYTEFRDEPGRELFYGQGFRWNKNTRRQEKRCRSFYVKGIQLALGSRDLFIGDHLMTRDGEQAAGSSQSAEGIPF